MEDFSKASLFGTP